MIGQLVLGVVAGLLTVQLSLFGTSIYFHRSQTHRALHVNRALDAICRVLMWLTTGMARRQWVTVHRVHHARTDDVGDPHSPAHHGLVGVLLGTAVLYRRALNHHDLARWTRDIEPDRLDRLTERWGWLGPLLSVVVLVVVVGPVIGLAWSATHALVYLTAGGLVNALGHQRPGGQIRPRDSFLATWFAAGEGNHAFHHRHPRAAHFAGTYPDLSWPVIRLLQALGLVTIASARSVAGARRR